jgi:uncharacterized integral membrane protein
MAQGQPPIANQRSGFVWTPKLIVWTVILVILLVFILQNFDSVDFRILFWEFSIPLAVILLIFGVGGYVLGWLRPHFRSGRSR